MMGSRTGRRMGRIMRGMIMLDGAFRLVRGNDRQHKKLLDLL